MSGVDIPHRLARAPLDSKSAIRYNTVYIRVHVVDERSRYLLVCHCNLSKQALGSYLRVSELDRPIAVDWVREAELLAGIFERISNRSFGPTTGCGLPGCLFAIDGRTTVHATADVLCV